jgi:hypothetical protein
MRSALVALAVAVFAVLVLVRGGFARAEPPPPMEERPLSKVIEALQGAKGMKAQLATARFYAEVFGGKTVQAPQGSPLTTLGAWGDDGNLLAAEASLGSRSCGAASAGEKKAALALLGEFGAVLPASLRGYALLEQGKNDEAASIFTDILQGALPSGGCPGEHPMYSHRRVARMSMALACVKRATPKKSVEHLEKLLEKAKSCANDNHAVG